jgi:hypothetical protein
MNSTQRFNVHQPGLTLSPTNLKNRLSSFSKRFLVFIVSAPQRTSGKPSSGDSFTQPAVRRSQQNPERNDRVNNGPNDPETERSSVGMGLVVGLQRALFDRKTLQAYEASLM